MDETVKHEATHPGPGGDPSLPRVLDTLPALVWSALPDGSIDYLNRRWREYTGLSAGEGVTSARTLPIHPDDRSSFLSDWRRAVATEQPFETEARVQRADGDSRWLLVRAVPLRDNAGAIVRWYGTGIPVEDRERAEQVRVVQDLYADVTAVFCRSASLKQMLNECVEAIVRHVDVALARIWTLDKEQTTLELRASAGMYTRLDGSHSRIPVGKQKIGMIAEERTPHLTNDVANDPRVVDKAWARNEGIVSFAGYPLLVEDTLVGVVGMFARRPLAPDLVEALAGIAALIAQSIERKRVEEALREHDAQFRIRAEHVLQETGRRLAAQSRALTELTATHARGSVAFDERLRVILQSSARTLGVERVSVWEFTEDRASIRCVDLFTAASARHTAGLVLSRDRYPRYFTALERERLIAAADAHLDERTSEFSADYLVACGIGAMLDVPLRQDDLTVGVLCLEHVGGARPWSADEQNFVLSVANLVVAARADEGRRHALVRLAESEARARLIVDTAHDAFIGIDSAGQIVSWNAQAETSFGWTRAEAVGRNLVETIIPPKFREAHVGGMRRFLESGEAPIVNRRLELSALHRSGREFPIEITVTSPMKLEGGYLFGAFLRDISDRHERDGQLRRAKETAEAATRAKSDFLANMSHELRTPLNGVIGYAQLLQRDRTLNPAQHDAVDAISKCGTHLLELINDILDLSRIEAGRLEIEGVVTDLAQLIVDLRYVVAEAARRKGLRLTMEIASDVPRRVVLDGRHLRQVLLNLLGNAIKFTEQGEVRLAITRASGDRLLCEVTDTGIGIEPEGLEQIFDAFIQTDAGVAAGGSGLGLTISHRLIRSMGDELRVTSTPHQGSRFYFALPLVPAGATEAAAPQDSDLLPFDGRLADGDEMTTLIADDSTVSRRILAALLESAGVRVITAAGGYEALQLARAHLPDVVLMDVRMGDLDGLEVTQRLRADAATARIPVIAVTASALANTRQAAYDAGCVDYLPKPIRAEALFAALQAHVGVRFVRNSEPSRLSEPDLTDLEHRLAIAARMTGAVAVGDVTDLEALARELTNGSEAETALGQRVARLIANFDFDGLLAVAGALAGNGRGT